MAAEVREKYDTDADSEGADFIRAFRIRKIIYGQNK